MGSADARRLLGDLGRELRDLRRGLGLSQRAAGRRAGMSGSQLGRIERGDMRRPSVEQLARGARALGHKLSMKLYPDGIPVRDRPQLALLDRLERVLHASLRLLREVGLPIVGDLRAWDGRISDGTRSASFEMPKRDFTTSRRSVGGSRSSSATIRTLAR
jgi:transcriptional regulator with XRE-family HTH domain